MATSLKYNAYHVLGLEGSAGGRRILQRSNEIIQRLKIDDVPKYILDIPAFRSFRTEETVKDAVRRLQAPKSQIKEYFFWFRLGDDVDKQAARFLVQGDYRNAIQVWQPAASGESESCFRYKRNLALAHSVALLAGNDESHLQDSLNTWKSIVESKAFWSSFVETYKHDGDHAASDEVMADFETNVSNYLADIYAELQEACGTTEYVFKFRQLFSAKGERIEKDILNPTYQAIHGAIDSLEKISVGEKDRFDPAKAGQIKTAVGLIQSELNKLIKAGLFDDSGTKVVRDHAANALRRIVLDLHNYHNEFKTSFKLLEVATQIAGTDNFKAQLSAELAQIQKSISADEENTLTLEIPGALGGGTVVFKGDHLSYGNQKIFYKDATSISYHAVSSSINFIPISQSYSYMVATKSEQIAFSFGTTLYIGNEKKKDVWQKLAGISQHIIEPHIVKKLVSRIFIGGETVTIGGIEFGQEGYARSKMFGGQDVVAWTDTVYVPAFSSGSVVLWKAKDGKSAQFATVPMSTPNAAVLPEFVKGCVDIVQSHAKR
jgi:hypothetical protein